jgi:hypothetical protein
VWTIRPGVDETRHFVGRFLLAPDERIAVVEGQAQCDLLDRLITRLRPARFRGAVTPA